MGGIPMYEVSISTHFSAAHHLRGYQGSCAAPHGHNWEVEVFVQGEELNGTGILLDFKQLKLAVQEELSCLDHTDLNTVDAFRESNPTSENLARHLFRALSGRLTQAGCRVSKVSVKETPGSKASYWEA
jgi:6-pyruvoyltetrahydropterin/6-carboxytetrahydropterin synthase